MPPIADLRFRRIVFFLSVLALLAIEADSQNERRAGRGTRLYFGPVIGFYGINENHALSPSSRTSLCAGFKRELRVSSDFKSFFLFGAEYFFHGLAFRSYYFQPDSIKLYDRTFAFGYRVTVHEINLPFQYKFLFRRQDNYLFSPYVAVAYHLRYLLSGKAVIERNGEFVADRDVLLQFKNPLIHRQLNSFVSLSAGWQRNSLRNSKAPSFYAELNFRYGFSPYYFEEDFAPSSLYINSSHLALQLGFKF